MGLYIRCSTGRKRYAFDLLKVNKDVLDSLYDYIENENVYIEKFPKILEDNPEAREIKPRSDVNFDSFCTINAPAPKFSA